MEVPDVELEKQQQRDEAAQELTKKRKAEAFEGSDQEDSLLTLLQECCDADHTERVKWKRWRETFRNANQSRHEDAYDTTEEEEEDNSSIATTEKELDFDSSLEDEKDEVQLIMRAHLTCWIRDAISSLKGHPFIGCANIVEVGESKDAIFQHAQNIIESQEALHNFKICVCIDPNHRWGNCEFGYKWQGFCSMELLLASSTMECLWLERNLIDRYKGTRGCQNARGGWGGISPCEDQGCFCYVVRMDA